MANIKIGSIIKLNDRPYEITNITYSHGNNYVQKILMEGYDIFTYKKLLDVISKNTVIEIIHPDIQIVDVLGINENIITIMFANNEIHEIYLYNNKYCEEIIEPLNNYKNVKIELLSYNNEYKIIKIKND